MPHLRVIWPKNDIPTKRGSALPPEYRTAAALEEIVKKLSHIEDWLGELTNLLKRK